MLSSNTFFERLEHELPLLVRRTSISRITGGLIAGKTIANADALGTGPKHRVKCGSRVAYPKDDFIDWLRNRIIDVETV